MRLARFGAPLLLVLAVVMVCSPATSAAPATPVAFGAYVPGADDDPGRIDAFARQAGRSPVIVLSYKDWRSIPFDRDELDSIWRRGAVPMITWEPRAAERPRLSAARDRRRALRSLSAPRRRDRRGCGASRCFVRFAHEMNGDLVPVGAGGRRQHRARLQEGVEARRRPLPLSRGDQREMGLVAERGLRRQLPVRAPLSGRQMGRLGRDGRLRLRRHDRLAVLHGDLRQHLRTDGGADATGR